VIVWTLPIAVIGTLALAGVVGGNGSAARGQAKKGAVRANPATGRQRGGDLIIGRAQDTLALDPTTRADNESLWIDEQMYETLYFVTADGKGLRPWLATSFTLSPDKKTWTFHLRPGVRFNDGTPMTSADVKFSLDRARRGPTSGFSYLDSAINSVEAPNPSTVVVRTKYPWAPLLADLAIFTNGIVKKNLDGKSPAEFFKHPISTGPFMLDHWTKGVDLKVVRNPDYWQKGKPYLDSVTWRIIPDDNSRILQLKGGQIQVNEFPPFSAIRSLKATPGIVVSLFRSTRVDFYYINNRAKPYNDVHVRRAIAHVIDRSAIIKAAFFGNAAPANSYMPPSVPFYNPQNRLQALDLALARKELAQSSVPHGFKAEVLVAAGDVVDTTIAEILQQELKPLGITVTLKAITPSNTLPEFEKFHYQLFHQFWTNDIADPDEQTTFFLDPAIVHSVFSGYNNPQVTRLVRQAARQFNKGTRAALYAKIQAQEAKDVPHIPLFYVPYVWAYSTKVQGFRIFPTANQDLVNVRLKR